jgi:hypothetical protein
MREFNIDEELQLMLAEAKARGLIAHLHFKLCWGTTDKWRLDLIHDLSPFAHVWKLFVILVYFVGGLAVPPVVCWQRNSWSRFEKTFEFLLIAVLLTNSFFLLFTTQVQSNGRRVMTHKEIRAHYYMNELLIDLVATVTFISFESWLVQHEACDCRCHGACSLCREWSWSNPRTIPSSSCGF